MICNEYEKWTNQELMVSGRVISNARLGKCTGQAILKRNKIQKKYKAIKSTKAHNEAAYKAIPVPELLSFYNHTSYEEFQENVTYGIVMNIFGRFESFYWSLISQIDSGCQ